MTAVKICGLTRLEDALWASRCGADLMGFIFWPPSPRAVSVARAAEITEHLRAEGCRALLVGVFVNEKVEHIQETVRICGLDLVQLHGDESPDEAASLGLPYLLARRVRDAASFHDLGNYFPWGYVLDSYDPERPGGTGAPWRWDLLNQVPRLTGRHILAGGLTPENVREAIQAAHPWGVDVASGVEARPGIKDPALVSAFIHQVREKDTCHEDE